METLPARHFVWDLPIRICHWTIVLLVAFSWWSAENHEMEWHYRSGLALCALVIFRIAWGFFGTSSARFADFVKGPGAVLAYLRPRGLPIVPRLGHNPLGGWSVVLLIGLLALQVTTGLFAVDIDGLESGPLSYLVDFDQGRTAAEIHEVSFNLLLALIALHVVAVLFYLLARRKNLITAMFTGVQRLDGAAAPAPVRRVPAWRVALTIVLAAAVTYAVARGFRF
jgi:cytochrome b